MTGDVKWKQPQVATTIYRRDVLSGPKDKRDVDDARFGPIKSGVEIPKARKRGKASSRTQTEIASVGRTGKMQYVLALPGAAGNRRRRT